MNLKKIDGQDDNSGKMINELKVFAIIKFSKNKLFIKCSPKLI